VKRLSALVWIGVGRAISKCKDKNQVIQLGLRRSPPGQAETVPLTRAGWNLRVQCLEAHRPSTERRQRTGLSFGAGLPW
jgi:hypothetical protein